MMGRDGFTSERFGCMIDTNLAVVAERGLIVIILYKLWRRKIITSSLKAHALII
jgi:hypothetical protein